MVNVYLLQRILCLIPFPAQVQTTAVHIGAAVSDPYLSFATPISANHSLNLTGGNVGQRQLLMIEWESWLGYNDEGGIIFLPPMNGTCNEAVKDDHQSQLRLLVREICAKEEKSIITHSIKKQISPEKAQEMEQKDPMNWDNVMRSFKIGLRQLALKVARLPLSVK